MNVEYQTDPLATRQEQDAGRRRWSLTPTTIQDTAMRSEEESGGVAIICQSRKV